MAKGFMVKHKELEPGNNLYLYAEGDEKTSLTGGWVQNTNGSGTRTFSKETNHIYLTATSSSAYISAETNNKINLTDINTLRFELENTGSSVDDNRVYLALGSVKNENGTSTVGEGGTIAMLMTTKDYAKKTFSLDVSSVSGEYYVRVCAYGRLSANTYLKIFKVWGE